MGNLRVAFVGIGRHGSTIPTDYLNTFVQFHLELPFAYARHSKCDVDVWMEDIKPYSMEFNFVGGGRLQVMEKPANFNGADYDVVVHWRKWCDEAYVGRRGKNVILSQDHSYSNKWIQKVQSARPDAILVFPGWHQQQINRELGHARPPGTLLIPGLTLGVDTDVYRPASHKDPFHLLWASDPGRGLSELIPIFLQLYARDRRYRLTVTYPDYVKPEAVAPYSQFFMHHAVRHLPSLRNGPELWNLFNENGVLPYTSTFMEPSSRCHRQAMAAGSLVLYPPDRGTPSDLIDDGITGIVQRPHLWADLIHDHVTSGRWKEIGDNARSYALSESWPVQAARFHKYFSGA